MICKLLGHKYFLAAKTSTVLNHLSDVTTKSVQIILVCRKCGKMIKHEVLITSNK